MLPKQKYNTTKPSNQEQNNGRKPDKILAEQMKFPFTAETQRLSSLLRRVSKESWYHPELGHQPKQALMPFIYHA